MTTLRSILLVVLAISLFQCQQAEQTEDTSAQSTDTALNNTSEQTPNSSPTSQAVAVANKTAQAPSKVAAAVPDITIDTEKAKAVVRTINSEGQPTVKAKENTAPTVIEFKTPPPPPAPVEEKPTIEEPQPLVEEMAVIPPPNHSSFDALLQKAVSSSGKVNYRTIKSNISDLDAYIAQLAVQVPDGSWSRNNAMAYWINAYNAFTLKLVTDNYPISSIKDLHGGNPWGVKWIKLAGKSYSLDQIENQILRPRYKDARIHFAVNCAAKSCPPLHNSAFTEGNLNSKLERLTRNFINNSSFNTISTNNLRVSQIFNWYAQDFGTLTDFINRYTDTEINSDASVDYKEYNWSLNE